MVEKILIFLFVFGLLMQPTSAFTLNPFKAKAGVKGCAELNVKVLAPCSQVIQARPVLRIDQVTNSSVSLGWSDLPGVVEYVILRKTDHGYTMIGRVPWRRKSFTDMDVQCEKSYSYRVFSRGNSKNSPMSNIVTAVVGRCN